MNTYIFHITPYDLLFVGTIFIGLLFILLLVSVKRTDRAANRFLGLALMAIIFRLIWILAIDANLGTFFPHWSRLPLGFSLAIGPLIYFYVLKKTRPEYRLGWKVVLHFSPLLLELGAFALQISESISTGAATYETFAFKQWNPVVQILAIISVITYIVLSCRLINNFHRQLMPYVSRKSRYVLRWLYRLLVGFGAIHLLWLPFIIADYFYQSATLSADYPFYLLSAIIMIWISVAALLKKEVEIPVAVPQIAKSSPSADLMQKGAWLKNAIECGKLYEDAELTLNSLAGKLDIHHHELSRIVNTAFGKNFNDFINEYRIREVGRKIKDPAYNHITLLGIAFESRGSIQNLPLTALLRK